MLVAKTMRSAQVGRQLLVVVAQLGEHVQGRNVIGVVIQKTLQTANVADRTQCRSADLADALSDCVCGGEDLLGMFVEQKMIVAEMWSRHMPMKVLRCQI